jgi:hypothetical protein
MSCDDAVACWAEVVVLLGCSGFAMVAWRSNDVGSTLGCKDRKRLKVDSCPWKLVATVLERNSRRHRTRAAAVTSWDER